MLIRVHLTKATHDVVFFVHVVLHHLLFVLSLLGSSLIALVGLVLLLLLFVCLVLSGELASELIFNRLFWKVFFEISFAVLWRFAFHGLLVWSFGAWRWRLLLGCVASSSVALFALIYRLIYRLLVAALFASSWALVGIFDVLLIIRLLRKNLLSFVMLPCVKPLLLAFH